MQYNLDKKEVKKIWLRYFNDYLFNHGDITEKQRNEILCKINSKFFNNSNIE